MHAATRSLSIDGGTLVFTDRMNGRWKPLTLTGIVAALVLALLPAAAFAFAGKHETAAPPARPATPTIVLLHGAFADASGWDSVTAKLQAKGYAVIAPPNPLRGLDEDTAYLKDFLSTISGPLVLVGHSYAGAIITNAATGNQNVKALVYAAAYAPEQGETIAQAGSLAGGRNDLQEHLVLRPYPGSGANADASIDPAWFHQLFAADVPPSKTRLMATQQRPLSTAAFAGQTGEPAWKTIPAYYLVTLDDRTIPPVSQKAMAARAAKGRTVEVHSSHAVMLSHPAEIIDLILRAARS